MNFLMVLNNKMIYKIKMAQVVYNFKDLKNFEFDIEKYIKDLK